MLIDKFISKKGKEKKITSTIINANIGERKNWILFDILGITTSFEKSLIASLKGWSKPIILTLLGPLRIWL